MPNLSLIKLHSSQIGQTPVENPLMTIENFNHQFRIGEEERETVKWGWEQEMGNPMFHVVNAYTRAVQFEGLPAEASYRPTDLQKALILSLSGVLLFEENMRRLIGQQT